MICVDCIVLPICLFDMVYVSNIVVHIFIASSGSVKYAYYHTVIMYTRLTNITAEK